MRDIFAALKSEFNSLVTFQIVSGMFQIAEFLDAKATETLEVYHSLRETDIESVQKKLYKFKGQYYKESANCLRSGLARNAIIFGEFADTWLKKTAEASLEDYVLAEKLDQITSEGFESAFQIKQVTRLLVSDLIKIAVDNQEIMQSHFFATESGLKALEQVAENSNIKFFSKSERVFCLLFVNYYIHIRLDVSSLEKQIKKAKERPEKDAEWFVEILESELKEHQDCLKKLERVWLDYLVNFRLFLMIKGLGTIASEDILNGDSIQEVVQSLLDSFPELANAAERKLQKFKRLAERSRDT